MAVFVLDRKGKPLMPCSEKRARLLARGRAVVHRLYPFVIRLKDRVGGDRQPLHLKFDPGANTTGVAFVRLADGKVFVLNLFELVHRGQYIHARMQKLQLQAWPQKP